MATCQIIESVALAFLAVGILGGWLRVGYIFAAIVVLGAAQAFERPTMSALLPNLVPPRLLARAIAMSLVANQSAYIIGPAVGGLLYAVHVAVPFALSACFVCCAGILMIAIRVPRSARPMCPRHAADRCSRASPLSWYRPILLGAVSLNLFAVLLGGTLAPLPIRSARYRKHRPVGSGILRRGQSV